MSRSDRRSFAIDAATVLCNSLARRRRRSSSAQSLLNSLKLRLLSSSLSYTTYLSTLPLKTDDDSLLSSFPPIPLLFFFLFSLARGKDAPLFGLLISVNPRWRYEQQNLLRISFALVQICPRSSLLSSTGYKTFPSTLGVLQLNPEETRVVHFKLLSASFPHFYLSPENQGK